jgi:hypothetical protein
MYVVLEHDVGLDCHCMWLAGVKCIGFKYSNEPVQGTLMGLGVLWVNLMSWSVREVIKVLLFFM